MKYIRSFLNNYAHPQGFIGRLIAYRRDQKNRAVNEWTLSLLDLQPGDQVLEVGFGSGLTLQKALNQVPLCLAAGVDSSRTMVNIALKRNAGAVSAGSMDLKLGSMETLPYRDQFFDKVYAVQVIHFLSDPQQGIRELYRVVRPGGRVALYFEPKEKFVKYKPLLDGIYRPYSEEEVHDLLQQAGFARVWVETREFLLGKVHQKGICVLGEK
jgi:ubiquinone/menaquinone biosynthesis C-methylase UbiE